MKKAVITLWFLLMQLCVGSRKAAYKKADFFHQHKLFKKFGGGGGYWHPRSIPSYPELISIGDNVTICADVKFFEHDIVHRMWNGNRAYTGPVINQYQGEITVGDNSVIGGNSIILYNVKIGNDVLVAAGSVVTHDVEDYAIVAGNPARKIGDTRELYKKRCG